MHVTAAQMHGLSYAELLAAIRFIAPYSGYPAAADALARLNQIATEIGMDTNDLGAPAAPGADGSSIESLRLLIPGGLACLVSLTHGRSTLARLVSRSWQRIWRLSPRLVGGCRPIDLRLLLESESWEVNEDVVIESWGVPSQVVVATARSNPEQSPDDSH
jgi:hypothetical protein